MNLDADGNAEEDQSIQRFSRIQIINLLIIKFKNFIFGGYKALLYHYDTILIENITKCNLLFEKLLADFQKCVMKLNDFVSY